MVWEKGYIHTDEGQVLAVKPVIISASRATDIPAFYSRWLMDKLRWGYVGKINPFNGKPETISFEKTRVIVLWSKYPRPMLQYLDELDRRGLNYYFLFTLNNYPDYEKYLPSLEKRVEVFRKLSDRLGPDRVLWRYDPLILSSTIDTQQLLARIEAVGKLLKGYTSRLIFSFVDTSYRKVQNALRRSSLQFFSPTDDQKRGIVAQLKQMADSWGMDLRSCADRTDYSALGVRPNKCIDDELMVKLFHHDSQLMEFLGYKSDEEYKSNPRLKDKGQRKFCGCIYSKDIGRYNTCPFGCVYCYANTSRGKALEDYKRHNYRNESL